MIAALFKVHASDLQPVMLGALLPSAHGLFACSRPVTLLALGLPFAVKLFLLKPRTFLVLARYPQGCGLALFPFSEPLLAVPLFDLGHAGDGIRMPGPGLQLGAGSWFTSSHSSNPRTTGDTHASQSPAASRSLLTCHCRLGSTRELRPSSRPRRG
jgi:hypothetical protein